MTRVYNFFAGPAILPLEVLQTVQAELLDYRGSGMSVMEMSHRDDIFSEIYADSIRRLRALAAVPDRFDILYMTGGASAQFALVPLNLSAKGHRVGFVHTGVWTKKAIAEARLQELEIEICGSSEESGFDRIPEEIRVSAGLDYLHIVSNNTIYGTQYRSFPSSAGNELVIDMSSDFLSRPIDWSDTGLVFAGAQKNAGPSGLTIVILDRKLYEREPETLPTMFRYSTFGKNESRYNTPPTFQIYIFDLILQWLEREGGLSGMAGKNQEKAALIYEQLDAHPDVYEGHARSDSRSLMNITFRLKDEGRNEEFLRRAQERGMVGLKGHRSVGGFRASVYNSMPVEGCRALADFLRQFAER